MRDVDAMKMAGSKVFELSETERKVWKLREQGVEVAAVAERLGLSKRYVRTAYLLAKDKVAVGAKVGEKK